MDFTRKLAVAATAVAMTAFAMPAGAQNTFNFFTTGQFTGGGATCENPVAAAFVQCGGVDSGLGLSFTGVSAVPGGFASGSQVQLGKFQPLGTGTVTVPPPDVMFKLFINQTDPTTGTSSVVGGFAGTFSQGAGFGNNSTLIYSPSQTTMIGPVQYSLIFNNDPNTGAPLGGIAVLAVNPTTIGAIGTSTVPEPSSMALLGTGLIGLVPLVRRKKNS